MQVPAAMFVEAAVDSFGSVPDAVLADQTKELGEGVGESAATKLGLTYPLSQDAIIAYRLGLQTARMMLAENTTLLMKGIDPGSLL